MDAKIAAQKATDYTGVSTSTELTRGQKLWNTLRDRRDTEPVSLERAKLLTASYKETEGLFPPIRRAKAMEKILTEIPIFIDEGQLLAGDWGARPMAAEWFPELNSRWVREELEAGVSPYQFKEEELALLREICEYWKGRDMRDSTLSFLGEEQAKKILELTEEGAMVFAALAAIHNDKGFNSMDYEKAISKGFSGVIAEIEEELAKTQVLDDESHQKVVFLKALIIGLEAGIKYGKRYAALARKLAKTAKGERRLELEKIAEVCEWVPANPARSFHEALQTVWFLHLFGYLDVGAPGESPGRMDQYLYPYYKRDTEEGKLTREEAIELLECLRVKMSSQRQFVKLSDRERSSGEAQFHNVTLGGQTSDGKDATNELSYLFLEAAFRTRTPHHTLSVRWHDNLSPDFALKAVELASLGCGWPAFFGDKASIAFLLEHGASIEEARNYCLGGCVIHHVAAKTGPTWPITYNMGKLLELTLNNGFDPRTGKQLGPKTGKFEDFQSIDELIEAFKKQIVYFLPIALDQLSIARLHHERFVPQIFCSAFLDDCIKRGKSSMGDGTPFQVSYINPCGVISVTDALAALQKRVFEDGTISKKELMEALAVNFEGKEDLRQLLLSAPKYGNDDDYVDHFAVDIYSWICRITRDIDVLYGYKIMISPHSISIHGHCGQKTGALPSGRMAWETLTDGAVSPTGGADFNGPTAVINSATKVDQHPFMGAVFNMKFTPSSLKTKEDKKKLLTLIKTYFDCGGKHIQFNVVDRQTLLDAQEHPERHRNLLVRVAGYSALFVELSHTVQSDIIKRTEEAFN